MKFLTLILSLNLSSAFALTKGEAWCLKEVFPLVQSVSLITLDNNMLLSRDLCNGLTEAQAICISGVIKPVFNSGIYNLKTVMVESKKLCQ